MKRIKNWALPAVLTFAALPAFADGNNYGGYDGYMMGGHGFFGGTLMLLFWVVIIGLVVLAVRWFGDNNKGGGKETDAMSILRDRLARGEIDPEEFEARRKSLEG